MVNICFLGKELKPKKTLILELFINDVLNFLPKLDGIGGERRPCERIFEMTIVINNRPKNRTSDYVSMVVLGKKTQILREC